MAELKISQMTQATEEQLTDGALMEVAVEDGNSSTGYSTKSGSLARLKEFMVGEVADELLANQNGGYVRKNLLPSTHQSGTQNGITFTLNDDGSISANGTNSGGNFVWYVDYVGSSAINHDWNGQSLIMTGCPSGGSGNTYALRLYRGGSGTNIVDAGSGVSFTGGSTDRIGIYVTAGTALNNLTFYPMVRPATIEDGTYVPYAPSNSALNADLTNRTTTKTGSFVPSLSVDVNKLVVKQYGQVVHVRGYITFNSAIPTSATKLGNLSGVSFPTGENIRTLCLTANNGYTASDYSYITINTGGEINVTPRTSYKTFMINITYIV